MWVGFANPAQEHSLHPSLWASTLLAFRARRGINTSPARHLPALSSGGAGKHGRGGTVGRDGSVVGVVGPWDEMQARGGLGLQDALARTHTHAHTHTHTHTHPHTPTPTHTQLPTFASHTGAAGSAPHHPAGPGGRPRDAAVHQHHGDAQGGGWVRGVRVGESEMQASISEGSARVHPHAHCRRHWLTSVPPAPSCTPPSSQ